MHSHPPVEDFPNPCQNGDPLPAVTNAEVMTWLLLNDELNTSCGSRECRTVAASRCEYTRGASCQLLPQLSPADRLSVADFADGN